MIVFHIFNYSTLAIKKINKPAIIKPKIHLADEPAGDLAAATEA
ncbi:MAG TPA: hypothetical protein VHA30_01900 [Patescibacteria group bacterium]|nr:hypothetical protein [Patescibacteria group bacterium]